MRPPQSPIAQRQEPAAAATETAKPTPASQSHLASAAPTVSSAAATAIGAALGINQPLAAAVVIVPALDVAGLIPLTPGNFGVTSGAIAMALQAHGMSFTNGLAAGIAFHAVETAVGLMFGMASIVWLAPYPSPAARRIALLAGAASWALAIAGAFSATVLSQFV